jgi:hypothetical protein
MGRDNAPSILSINRTPDIRTKVLESGETVGRKCCCAASDVGQKKSGYVFVDNNPSVFYLFVLSNLSNLSTQGPECSMRYTNTKLPPSDTQEKNSKMRRKPLMRNDKLRLIVRILTCTNFELA